MADILIRFDEEEAREGLDDLEQEAATAFTSILTNIRRTAEVAIFFAEASGIAIDSILQLYITGGLRIFEFIGAAGLALSAGTFGAAAALNLGAQALAVGLMFAQINALQRQQTETARRIGLATSGLRALTF